MKTSPPSSPVSSPMTAKMKSVWAFGQIAVAGDAGPQAVAEHVPVAEGQKGLHGLVAGIGGVFERMEERRHAPPAVRAPRWRRTARSPRPPASRPPSGLNGIPAVNSIATAMQASTMVVPMSGWAMTSTTSKAEDRDHRDHLVAPVPPARPADRGCRPRTGPAPAWPARTAAPAPTTFPATSRPRRPARRSREPARRTAGRSSRTWRPGPAAASARDRRAGPRANPTAPIANHISCRSKKCHGDPNCWRLTIDEADSTITTPIRHRMATRTTSTQKAPALGGEPAGATGVGPLVGSSEGESGTRFAGQHCALSSARGCGSRSKRSGRPGRHTTGTSRSWRTPETAATASPGSGQASGRVHGGVHAGGRRVTGDQAGEGRLDLGGRLPDGDHGAHRRDGRAPGPRDRVPCCGRRRSARPTENPATAASTDAGRGRLGVVVPAHPAGLADEADPVRQGRRCRPARRRHPARVAPAAVATAAAARALARSWGRARGSSATGIERRAARAGEPVAVDAVVRPGPEREGTTRRRRRGCAAAAADTIGSSALTTAVSPVALVGPDAGLGGRVVRPGRVPVEVVGSQVEPAADRGPERLGELQLERRHLRDHDLAPATRPPRSSGRRCCRRPRPDGPRPAAWP